jgi:hypothetical protein
MSILRPLDKPCKYCGKLTQSEGQVCYLCNKLVYNWKSKFVLERIQAMAEYLQTNETEDELYKEIDYLAKIRK